MNNNKKILGFLLLVTIPLLSSCLPFVLNKEEIFEDNGEEVALATFSAKYKVLSEEAKSTFFVGDYDKSGLFPVFKDNTYVTYKSEEYMKVSSQKDATMVINGLTEHYFQINPDKGNFISDKHAKYDVNGNTDDAVINSMVPSNYPSIKKDGNTITLESVQYGEAVDKYVYVANVTTQQYSEVPYQEDVLTKQAYVRHPVYTYLSNIFSLSAGYLQNEAYYINGNTLTFEGDYAGDVLGGTMSATAKYQISFGAKLIYKGKVEVSYSGDSNRTELVQIEVSRTNKNIDKIDYSNYELIY